LGRAFFRPFPLLVGTLRRWSEVEKWKLSFPMVREMENLRLSLASAWQKARNLSTAPFILTDKGHIGEVCARCQLPGSSPIVGI
jgi:hypothetical protein